VNSSPFSSNTIAAAVAMSPSADPVVVIEIVDNAPPVKSPVPDALPAATTVPTTSPLTHWTLTVSVAQAVGFTSAARQLKCVDSF